MFTIELRPHRGLCSKGGGMVELEHNQWVVIAARSGVAAKQVGYLARRADAKLMPLSTVPGDYGDFLYGELCKSVEAARDAELGKGASE